ncbi:PilZ domain-containing protein [Bradyrhizobium sp. AUGA SZCCT0283]|uniref:PilZ domain-containing protein n=1 Tax=Bradyrhizobium sp. AUGA SZCCT0283 TaxID=2807671 RepID=UPI001BA7CA9A|nr:PilZ domain-containing protein [Bradyrhizobium sp. AUGA SZCCT0283]
MHGLRRTHFTREVRRRRYQSAWITTHGLADYECRLSNLSQSGAELVVGIGDVLPSRFQIRLVPNSARAKYCEVVWRQGKTIGVRFTR